LLKRKFGRLAVDIGDFESFEAHHTGVKYQISQFWKRHVLQNVFGAQHFFDLESQLGSENNECQFKDVFVAVWQRLMSGKMTTSSDNAVLDLCLMLFMMLRTRYPHLTSEELVDHCDECPLIVEGDDNMSLSSWPKAQCLIDGLGIKLKMEHHSDFSQGSFCGIVADYDNLENVVDPRKVLADFGVLEMKWAGARPSRAIALVRAKAFSYGFAYGACPVVASYARYILRVTSGHDARWAVQHQDWYYRGLVDDAIRIGHNNLFREVQASTRLLVAKLYGVSLEQQKVMEDQFDMCAVLQPHEVGMEVPVAWRDFSLRYINMPPDITYPKPFYPAWLRDIRVAGGWRGPKYFDEKRKVGALPPPDQGVLPGDQRCRAG